MKRKRANLKMGQACCPVSVLLFFQGNRLKEIELEASPSFSLFIEGTSIYEQEMIRWFEAYLVGTHLPFPCELEWEIGPFSNRVLHALEKIPFGQMTTYGELAKKLGNPKGARAVGNACNQNPYPLIIPCHRVVMAGGKLGGFGYGCGIKKGLLQFEEQITQYQ